MEEGRKSAIKLPSWLLLQNWRKKLWFLWLCLFSPTHCSPCFSSLYAIMLFAFDLLANPSECVEKLRKVNPCKSWQYSVCFESWQIGGSKVPFVRSFVFWSLGLSSWWRLKKEETLFLKNTHVILERDVVGDDVVSAVFLSDFISGRASFSTHIFGLISVTKHQKCLCTLNISNLWKFYRLLQWLSKW